MIYEEVLGMSVNELQKALNDLYSGTADNKKHAEEYMNIFIDAYFNHAISEFSKESKKMSCQFEALREYLKIDEDNKCSTVYCFGIIDTIRNLSYKIAEAEAESVGDYSNYKYVYPVLEKLYKYGMVPIGKLADMLNVERHTLTNAFRRTNKFGLWYCEKNGRNSYYLITSKGEHAYEEYKKNRVFSNKKTMDEIMLILIKEIESHMDEVRPNANEIIHSINQNMECSAFSSPIMKIAIQNIYSRRDEYIKKAGKLKKDYEDNRIMDRQKINLQYQKVYQHYGYRKSYLKRDYYEKEVEQYGERQILKNS